MKKNTTNPTTRTVNVIAWTNLWSNTGMRQNVFGLEFSMNPKTGQISVTNERKGQIGPRIYQLLHLMAKVTRNINPALLAEGEDFARVVRKPCHQPGRYNLLFEYGKNKYRLDQSVDGIWISNPDLMPLVRTFVRLKEIDPIIYNWATKGEYEYMFFPEEMPHPWRVWIQP